VGVHIWSFENMSDDTFDVELTPPKAGKVARYIEVLSDPWMRGFGGES